MIKETLYFKLCHLSKKKDEFYVTIYPSFDDVPKDEWNSVENDKNVYLSEEYLVALERTMSSEMSFSYAVTYDKKDTPLMIQYFQIVEFQDKRTSHTNSFLNRIKGSFGRESEGFQTDILVCGNVFCNGENGISFKENTDIPKLINAASQVAELVAEKNEHGKKTSLILNKEFWPKSNGIVDHFKDFGFQGFNIDVNMVLNIDSKWKSMDDYLGSMKTKYRTRAKGVFKKSKSIEIQEFSDKDIKDNKSKLQVLFNNVQNKSEFKMGTISASTFAEFKKRLPEKFILKAAIHKGELVGFSTSFINDDVLEANYVGIDYEMNKEMAVYQLLLYNLAEEAISRNLKELQLGRSSELVKSAMGAVPVNMTLFGKHKRKISNLFVKAVLKKIVPGEFELRQPFKQATV